MRASIITLFLLLTSSVTTICQDYLSGLVVKIADGDTMTILTKDKKQVKVRLHGVDTPEKKQDFGSKAQKFTSDLCFGKVVKIQKLNTDRYGRVIGLVILPDRRILNEELLKAGLAWHYTQYDKSKKYADLEARAKAKRVGIWSMAKPVAPWVYRKNKRTKKTTTKSLNYQ